MRQALSHFEKGLCFIRYRYIKFKLIICLIITIKHFRNLSEEKNIVPEEPSSRLYQFVFFAINHDLSI